ncbi:MAG TPA: DEAD/DEAH box helicase [Gemmatimonadales bacterium]|nr:DEAD/DEAH box helicase [Gemmatimonadales bacterium]
MRSSRLVAESLRVLPVPGAARIPPVEWCDLDSLRSLAAHAWSPERVHAPPPSCLFPSQHDSWRRAVAAVRCHGGAILAEPVGSGKSWIALAVAAEFSRRIAVIGPAAMRQQWLTTSSRAGIPIGWHSHELLSRGRLPAGKPGFVIVDEAHRFRHLETRRVHRIAPWIAGIPSLLLTATPVVNRRADLVALLRLILPDDTLLLDGVKSLRSLTDVSAPPPALRRVAVRSQSMAAPVATVQRRLHTNDTERLRGARIAEQTARLRLSGDRGVRALVMGVLLEAGASSDAAWHAALRRYRALLLQSRDAGGLSRVALRRFVGQALDQLQLWSLLPTGDDTDAPPLDDLSVVEELLGLQSLDESWLVPLVRFLRDGTPAICFTRHRATAIATIRHLGEGTAWVTGDAAGIGPHRLLRDQVLAAFRPNRDEWCLLRNTPAVLVTTEVVSEGLDLQGAARVVHLDLPWHASRMEQRTGRVARIGQRTGTVEVIERTPPPALERLLGMRRRVRRKGRLAAQWLEALSVEDGSARPPLPLTLCAVAPRFGSRIAAAVVGLGSADRTGTVFLVLLDGNWQGMDKLQLPNELHRPTAEEQRQAVRLARHAAWRALEMCTTSGVSRPRLQARLISLARRAGERRDAAAMLRIDRLLQAAGRAGPLGTEQVLTSLADGDDEVLVRAELPPPAPRRPVKVEWMALVLYRQG